MVGDRFSTTQSNEVPRGHRKIQPNGARRPLNGLDDRLDGVQADVLQMNPLPTVEQAYTRVRREDVRQSVMLGKSQVVSDSMAMVLKGFCTTRGK